MSFAITTARLHLLDMREEHRELYVRLFCDPEAMAHLGGPLTRERAQKAFAATMRSAASRPHERYLVLVDRVSDAAIGLGSIQHVDVEQSRAEVGLMLLPSGQRRGLAREALRAIVAFCFDTLGVNEVIARHAHEHTAAQKLVVALGFQPDGSGTEGDAGRGMRSWSVHREGWSCKENGHVGRHRVPGTNWPGCARTQRGLAV